MWGTHGKHRARAYNGLWGQSPQRGPGTEPLVRGSEGEAPEAQSFSALECQKEAAFWPFLGVLGT